MKLVELDSTPTFINGKYPKAVRGNLITGMQYAYYHSDGVNMYYLDEDVVNDIWSQYDSVSVAHEYLEKKVKELEINLEEMEKANEALVHEKKITYERLAKNSDRIRFLEEQLEELKSKPLDASDLNLLKEKYEVAEIIQLRKEGLV